MRLEYRWSIVGRRSLELFAKETSTCPYVLEALFVELEVPFSQLKVVFWRRFEISSSRKRERWRSSDVGRIDERVQVLWTVIMDEA